MIDKLKVFLNKPGIMVPILVCTTVLVAVFVVAELIKAG